MVFRQIADERLAQYAYLVGCQRTGEALLIDPERDIDRYLDAARAEGLEIRAVTETHIHADFLSGVRECAEQGVAVYLSDEGDADWKYRWVADGDYDVTWLKDGTSFRVGLIEFRVMHTPGHTPEHVSFLITDHGGGADGPMGLASGDFVFVGDLGRPDLLESAAGIQGAMEPSARELYRSAHAFLDLPDYLQVWPGHGAGSACGKALGAVPESTVGYERRYSPALRMVQQGEPDFVRFILEGQPEPPMYFADMKGLNRDGVPVLGALPEPEPLTVDDLAEVAMREDTVVIDTRMDRQAFFAAHVPGAVFAPFDHSFPTIVGSCVRLEQPVVLLVDPANREEAVRNLIRIGRDRIVGWVSVETFEEYRAAGGPVETTESVDLDEVRRRRAAGGVHLLDVRRATEFAEGHLPGAQNIAHTRLLVRLDEVPTDRPILVHCLTGARASSAASLLQRSGRTVVHVDDDLGRWFAKSPASAGAA